MESRYIFKPNPDNSYIFDYIINSIFSPSEKIVLKLDELDEDEYYILFYQYNKDEFIIVTNRSNYVVKLKGEHVKKEKINRWISSKNFKIILDMLKNNVHINNLIDLLKIVKY